MKRSRNHTANVMPGQRVVGDEAEPDVGLGEPVEGPEQPDHAERPADHAGAGRARSTTAASAASTSPTRRAYDPAGLRRDVVAGGPTAAGRAGPATTMRPRSSRGEREQRDAARRRAARPAASPAHHDAGPARRGPNRRRCRAARGVMRVVSRAERYARSPTRKPIAVTSSHSGPVMPAMYCSGEMPSSRVRPPSTRPTRPIQRGTPPRAVAANSGHAGEPGERPEPRDGADPVVEHRGVGVVDGVLDREAYDELGVEAAAHHRDDRGADQAGERHAAVRQRRVGQPRRPGAGGSSPAAKTTSSTAPTMAEGVEGDMIAGSGRRAWRRCPAGSPDEVRVVDRVDHRRRSRWCRCRRRRRRCRRRPSRGTGRMPVRRSRARGPRGRSGPGCEVVTWVLTVVPLCGGGGRTMPGRMSRRTGTTGHVSGAVTRAARWGGVVRREA